MHHDVRWTSRAQKELRRFDLRLQARVRGAVALLAADPRSRQVRKLAGIENCYRLRVGDLRVLFEIHDRCLLVLVVHVRNRREAYD